jgi:hypothetical protein
MTQLRLAVLILPLALLGCNQGPPPMPIKQFMAERVQPTADVYWGAVRYISDETGYHEYVPETDADWERARKAAADLAAFGEQLKTEAYTEGRGADWAQFAQSLVDVSKQAEQAAVEKNVDEVFEVGGTVYAVCSACHQVYPPAGGATGTP